jgi:sphingomyelin phosphodiesterase
VLVTDPHADF